MLSPVVDVDYNSSWFGVVLADQYTVTGAIC